MKLCISGPQCCGKSSLLNSLKEQGSLFKGYTFIDEPIRKLVAEKNIKINKDCTYYDQLLILQEHHKNVLRYDKFITDRGSLDAFTYATHDYLNGKYSFNEWATYIAIHEQCMKYYDLIFILDPLPMKDDGFRSLDTVWQQEIYDLMIRLAAGRAIIVPDYSIEERVEFVYKHVYSIV
jgi:predicted ATPase